MPAGETAAIVRVGFARGLPDNLDNRRRGYIENRSDRLICTGDQTQFFTGTYHGLDLANTHQADRCFAFGLLYFIFLHRANRCPALDRRHLWDLSRGSVLVTLECGVNLFPELREMPDR